MSRGEWLDDHLWVAEERQEWSPTVKMLLAFILGMLALSPATFWEFIGKRS